MNKTGTLGSADQDSTIPIDLTLEVLVGVLVNQALELLAGHHRATTMEVGEVFPLLTTSCSTGFASPDLGIDKL